MAMDCQSVTKLCQTWTHDLDILTREQVLIHLVDDMQVYEYSGELNEDMIRQWFQNPKKRQLSDNMVKWVVTGERAMIEYHKLDGGKKE